MYAHIQNNKLNYVQLLVGDMIDYYGRSRS